MRILRKADIQPHVPVQHGPTTSIYYRDLDGNMVELQIDNFTTPEEATEYLRGEEFRADPFGRLSIPTPQRNVPELLLT
jgi:hypothetical protein